MKYHLKYIDIVDYWVEAETEEEALAKVVPEVGHRVSIEVIKDLPPLTQRIG